MPRHALGVRGSGNFTRKLVGVVWRTRESSEWAAAEQDHRPVGQGGPRVCHPEIWTENSGALFAPTRPRKPRCVLVNAADLACGSGIVLRVLPSVKLPLEPSHACRYTLDMAYCIGRASLGRRMASGLQ